jgi:hypothetical protein
LTKVIGQNIPAISVANCHETLKQIKLLDLPVYLLKIIQIEKFFLSAQKMNQWHQNYAFSKIL